MDPTVIYDPLPEAVFPASMVYGSNNSYAAPVYPGALTGSVGATSGVTTDFIGGAATGAAANLSYGQAAAKKPFWDQPVFWAFAVFAIGAWLLAHIALVQVKS